MKTKDLNLSELKVANPKNKAEKFVNMDIEVCIRHINSLSDKEDLQSAKYKEALERIANQTDEMVDWKDAGVRCRHIALEALK